MVDGIAAIVNNQIITMGQLENRTRMISAELGQQKITLPSQNVLINQVLQMMINQTLQQQTAQRLNITATTQDIQQGIQLIAQQQNTTPEALQASLAQQGISEEEFINQLKQQIINQKLLEQAVASQIVVLPQEIEAGMKIAQAQVGAQNTQYHLLEIVVGVPSSPSPEQVNMAEQKALSIFEQLQKGADFKTLAVAESSSSSAFDGGDIGWKTINELPPSLASSISSMKTNDLAGPFQSSDGFHIFKLIDVKSSNAAMSNDQLRQQVAQLIFQRKLQEKQQAWLDQLRAGAYIKILYKPAD
jgi:peptidyl-prolyl cis-trans isomerase SurA